MNDGIYLYPRLDQFAASIELESQMLHTPVDLLDRGNISHANAAPSATGGIPVPADLLLELQRLLREVAKDFNFPEPLNMARQQEFDRICGTLLFQKMRIVTGDAAEEGVWSFLSLVVVPEIAPWRFPSRHPNRLLGKSRNTFRRLWWRAWSLGPDLTEPPQGTFALNEDDYFQIMERTKLSGDRRTAQAIKQHMWTFDLQATADEKQSTRNHVLREVIKRLRAAKSHIAFHALSDDQLASLIDECTHASRIALGIAVHNAFEVSEVGSSAST